jgi:hypothetical protein
MTKRNYTFRPRSTHFRATQLAAQKYTVNPRTGKAYNAEGRPVGGNTYEPRLTVHLGDGRKYNVRMSKLVAYITLGSEALRSGVSVKHKDGDKNNNKASNLFLSYNKEAAKAYRRRNRELQTA